LEAVKAELTESDYWKLRLLIHTHDTFKAEAEPGVSIMHPRSHVSLARAFLASFCDDADLLNMVQHHDEGYARWQQLRRKGRSNGAHEPGLRIADGDTVITTTIDAAGRDARNERVSEGGNPQTGPFYVEGAEPGDTLVFRIDRLEPNRDHGITGTVLAPNVVD